MEYSFWTLLLAVALVIFVYLTIKHMTNSDVSKTTTNSYRKQLPGPRSLPVIGNLHQLSARPFLQFTEFSKQYGPVFKVKFGSWNTVVLSNEVMMREAFVTQSSVFSGRVPFPSMKHINGGTSYIFNSFSEKWKLQKKILVRALDGLCKTDSLENYLSDMAESLAQNFIRSGQTDQAVDPIPAIKWQQTQLMLTLVFGPAEDTRLRTQQVDTLTNMLEEFIKAISRFVPFDVFPGLLKVFPYFGACMKQACVNLYDAITPLVEHAESVVQLPDSAIRFLKESLDQQDKLSKQEVLRMADDLLGAGLDTTTSLMSWMILYLARFPEMQEKVRQEIQTLKETGRSLNYNSRDYMPYSQACILEIARHSAVMPLTIPHYTLKDTELCGYDIPTGTMVFGNMHAICHDKELWDSPDEFRPERFLLKDGCAIDHRKVSQMNMYSVGKRRCIGDAIAKMELFLVFTKLVETCEIAEDPAHPLPIGKGHFEVTHRPYNYKVKIKAVELAAQ